ncbi:RDD family protein [Streptomyces malaysiensis]|uniref:RDD family protein n=1 Tax=Streptomyces malaysiensis subsp. samsunensis TaxID=459658 RepID=A0A9X2LZR5_STRMQ|nr:RDD family protein [Streptomyces samsunensis]MCQ8832757.1 RDD family protein [Streptomyces samsunensis]
MSAPTSGSADGSSIPGFYPDPSIPGYIRYWNGAAWVPGTSRPAPAEGEAMPAPPPGVTHTQVISPPPDETGPMFLDEDPAPSAAEETGSALPELRRSAEMDVRGAGGAPEAAAGGIGAQPVPPGGVPASVDWNDPQRLYGTRPEAGSAWQADASRQGGFGGERDRRISWGSETDAPGDPRAGGGQPGGGPRPGVPDPRRAGPDEGGGRDDGTLTMRAGGSGRTADRSTQALPPVRRAPELPPADEGETPPAAGDGTMTIRAVGQGGGAAPTTGQGQGQGRNQAPGRDDGTMAIRAIGRGGSRKGAGAAPPAQPPHQPHQPPQPHQPHQPPQPHQAQQPPQPHQPPQPFGGIPAQGGGGPAWPQQGPQHQFAQQPGPPQDAPEGVIPWKPPVDNPFLLAAQAEGRPAPLGRRLAARLVDTAVLLGIVGAVAFPLWGRASDHIDEKVETAKQSGETVTVYFLDGTTSGYLAIVLGLLLVFGVVLEALPTAKWGRTLGKRLCGVRVLDIEGHDKPSFGAALRRWLVYSVLGVLVIGVLNVLWCLFDRPWRQCWHDKAARTFVASAT